eukprot:125685-Chlamydomonas_euryale.AAC.5
MHMLARLQAPLFYHTHACCHLSPEFKPRLHKLRHVWRCMLVLPPSPLPSPAPGSLPNFQCSCMPTPATRLQAALARAATCEALRLRPSLLLSHASGLAASATIARRKKSTGENKLERFHAGVHSGCVTGRQIRRRRLASAAAHSGRSGGGELLAAAHALPPQRLRGVGVPNSAAVSGTVDEEPSGRLGADESATTAESIKAPAEAGPWRRCAWHAVIPEHDAVVGAEAAEGLDAAADTAAVVMAV